MTDFGYDYERETSKTLQKLCLDLDLNVPYTGQKHRKGDFRDTVEKHFALERLQDGKPQDGYYLRDDFDVRSYTVSQLRQALALHDIACVCCASVPAQRPSRRSRSALRLMER